ncbi:MAG: histidine--tRNA ligase [Candidatus Aenigmatarchaeota archaeon]
MTDEKKVKFQPVKGMRDFMLEDAEKLNFVLDTIRKVFEQYGFRPLETPALESFDLLAAKGGYGEAAKNEIYYFKDKSERELGLRFDLTMPLIRVFISSPTVPKPFKRYAIGKVWRYDNPQAQRYREFFQADIDVIGSSSTSAEAECVSAVIDVLKELGIEEFFVRVNNRKLVENAFKIAGITDDKIADAFRIVDKLDKIGEKGVREELEKKDIDPKEIIKFVAMTGNNDDMIKELGGRYRDGVDEIKDLLRIAREQGFDGYLKIDTSLVRGLDYYTGLVFEVMISDSKVSCGGGGRYDNIIKTLGGPDSPATGISIGVDRILPFVKVKRPQRRFFIASTNDKMRVRAAEIAKSLRGFGFICDIDLMGRKFNKQIEYADATGADFLIIVGEKEIAKGNIKLKNMKTGEERDISVNGLEELKKC